MYVCCGVILIDRIFAVYITYNNNNTLLSAFSTRSPACGRIWNSMSQAVCDSVWIWIQTRSLDLDMLLLLSQQWMEVLNARHEIRAISRDISRAFDTVWHRALLTELSPMVSKAISTHGS